MISFRFRPDGRRLDRFVRRRSERRLRLGRWFPGSKLLFDWPIS